MSDGHNRKFMADPAGYAINKTLLVPDHTQAGSHWDAMQDGPFDLRDFPGSGFDGTVLALTQMSRRAKAVSHSTAPIPGVWVPFRAQGLVQRDIQATSAPYFVFTSKLGGCALGIRDLNNPNTRFTHDASDSQTRNLATAALTLFPLAYDPGDTGVNVTAFFWWDGAQWNVGQSGPYDASYACQAFGNDEYPKRM